MSQRETWNDRLGLILAMAGNAVGLGNFLRFPVQAAQNGGGAFMIPYFISFVLLAIPLMWTEWTIGRYGGKFGHGSLPGMFDVMVKNKFMKYLGVIGLFISTIIMIYYVYLISWTLGFSFFTVTGDYFGMSNLTDMSHFLQSYQGMNVDGGHFNGFGTAYIFLLITFAVNFWVLYKGINKGIEVFAKIAMPTLLIFGIALMIWIFGIGTPDPAKPDFSVWNGFAFIWNPDFSKLDDPKLWLAAAGQVFFTLSVGMGTLQAYASYLRSKNDVALSGLTTASLNEFAEVIVGGSIAIPIAVAFFGVAVTTQIAAGGAFNLGFVSMGVIFQQIPGGQLVGFLWFFLLFFAGITSSVAMAQPLISFLKENFNFSHRKATTIIAAGSLICVQFVVFFLEFGFLDEMDYWAGTFGLVILALIEIVIFAWIFGMDKGWKELNTGSDIKVPKFFYYVIKYVTPLFLIILLVAWTIEEAFDKLLMKGVAPENIPYLWGARILMIVILLVLLFMIHLAWKRRNKNKEANNV